MNSCTCRGKQRIHSESGKGTGQCPDFLNVGHILAAALGMHCAFSVEVPRFYQLYTAASELDDPDLTQAFMEELRAEKPMDPQTIQSIAGRARFSDHGAISVERRFPGVRPYPITRNSTK